MFGYVWLCSGMFGYVRVCSGMFGYVRLCLAMFGSADMFRNLVRICGQISNERLVTFKRLSFLMYSSRRPGGDSGVHFVAIEFVLWPWNMFHGYRKSSMVIEHVPWPWNMFHGVRTCSMAMEHVPWQ